MSGSPKHCRPRLTVEQERRIREERERHAEAERQHRAAEELRRRQQRLAAARSAAQAQAAGLKRSFAQFAGSEAAAFATAETAALRERLVQAEAGIGRATDEAAVRAYEQQLARVVSDLSQTVAEAEAAARQSACIAREEAAIAVLRQLVAALDRHRSMRFDATGLRQVNELIEQATAALAAGEPQEAGRIAAAARAHLTQHRATADDKFAHWCQKRDRAHAALVQAGDRVAGLEVDPIVMRWHGGEVGALTQRLRGAAELVESENFSAAEAVAPAVIAECERLLAAAQETELKEAKRNYVVNGILQVMKDKGFLVQDGVPMLEQPACPSSAKFIHARRIGGGAISVSVPQDGDIWYDVEEFPLRAAAAPGGGTIRSCDEAEQQINALHQSLDQLFGIQMSELMWDDKDPQRIMKTADELPCSTSSTQQEGRAR